MLFWKSTSLAVLGLALNQKVMVEASDAGIYDSLFMAENLLEARFESYMHDYGKNYTDDAALRAKRYQAFRKNMFRIAEHNQKYRLGEVSFSLGLNEVADLTDEEYQQMLGYRYKGGKPDAPVFDHTSVSVEDVPEHWDWRETDKVGPVKNQGMCGSCWAFSAVASMESAYAIKHKLTKDNFVQFSEQELVDCTDGGSDTCTRGGEMQHGFDEIIKHHGGKIDTEDVYPYTATSKGVCHADDSKGKGHFTGFTNVKSMDEDATKVAVATNSVLAIGIDASSFLFQLYRHGVFHWPLCKNKPDELDHGVALAGYGTYKGKDFWLVKNSWGSGWGMHGYVMIQRNANNMCGVATDASFPTTD